MMLQGRLASASGTAVNCSLCAYNFLKKPLLKIAYKNIDCLDFLGRAEHLAFQPSIWLEHAKLSSQIQFSKAIFKSQLLCYCRLFVLISPLTQTI